MSDLPAPLTPLDCDLRGSEWMPLLGHRLFASDFEAKASDLEFRVALRLWWEAWQQVPAASLPNDDAVLCRLAGLGRDLKTWKKLRGGLALYGFTLCQDNRWYHHLLAEQALKSYECRVKAATTRHADAERLRRWRASNGSHPPQRPNGQAPPETPYETRFNRRFETPETPSETRSETDVKRVGQYKTVPDKGDKKVSILNNLLTTSPASARVVEACQAPAEGTYGGPALALATQTIVEKLGRKFESSGKNPQGKPPKLTVIEQINWVRRGPVLDSDPVLLEGEILEAPIRRGPQPPQRTVAEQLAALGFPQTILEAARMSTRGKISYARYLASNEWKARREQALYRAQHRCQSPLCSMGSLRAISDEDLAWMKREQLAPHAYRLEVHHLTYERVGREHPDDLIVLCPQCHADAHGLELAHGPEHTDKPFTTSIADALVQVINRMAANFDA